MPPYNNLPGRQEPDSPSLPSPVPQPGPVPPQPQQPAQPIQPVQSQEDANRYAFFMESKPKTSSPFPVVGRKMSPLLLIAGGAVVLLVIVILAGVLISSFSGGSSDTSIIFNKIIRDQQEIVRVDGLADQKVQADNTVNFRITSKLTAESRQKQFIDYASKHGVKVDTKNLDKYVGDSQTDSALNAAEAASTYDSSFTSIMNDMLTKYQADLQKLSSQAANNDELTLTQQSYDDTTLLKQMLSQQ